MCSYAIRRLVESARSFYPNNDERYPRTTCSILHLFLSEAKNSIVFGRITEKFSFQKGDIHDGGIIIDELKNVHLYGQRIFKFRQRSW